MTDGPSLRAAWQRDVGSGPTELAAYEALLARYGEPHRHYHTLRHVASVLAHLDRGLGAVEGVDPAPVRLAAWYHDAVYDPLGIPGASEEASAVLAERTLTDLGWPDPRAAEVARLVRLTATHEPAAGDLAGALLVDADLAILAADPAAYAAYATGVRAEYAHLDEATWRAGRSRVLDGLLAQPVLFRTPAFMASEARARANLRAERATLAT